MTQKALPERVLVLGGTGFMGVRDCEGVPSSGELGHRRRPASNNRAVLGEH